MNAEQKDHLQLLNDLGHPPQPEPVEPASKQEQKLKADILVLWSQHDQCEFQIAPLLYELCKTLHAPGKKGMGFDAWLKASAKPKTTAYRWIRRYCTKNEIEPPWPEEEKVAAVKSTSCQVAQPPAPPSRVPVPTTLDSAKEALLQFFKGLGQKQRTEYAAQLIKWIKEAAK